MVVSVSFNIKFGLAQINSVPKICIPMSKTACVNPCATLRKWKKQNFGPSFGPANFFSWVLPLLVGNIPSYHPMQFPGKLIDQT